MGRERGLAGVLDQPQGLFTGDADPQREHGHGLALQEPQRLVAGAGHEDVHLLPELAQARFHAPAVETGQQRGGG